MKLPRSLRPFALVTAGLATLVGCDSKAHTDRFLGTPISSSKISYVDESSISGSVYGSYKLTRAGLDYLAHKNNVPESTAVSYDSRFLDTKFSDNPVCLFPLGRLYLCGLLPDQANGYAPFLKFSSEWNEERGDKSKVMEMLAFLRDHGVTPDKLKSLFAMNDYRISPLHIALEDVVEYVLLGIPLEEVRQRARALWIDEALRK